MLTGDPYEQALAALERRADYERERGFVFDAAHFDPRRPAALLERLGNPQQAFASLHIAGTKGKGSAAAMAAAVLRAGGRRVGLYVSPHLCSIRERISVDGKAISRTDIGYLVPQVLEAARMVDEQAEYGLVTYFEALTALAFQYFARRRVDCVVAEVGLGGRLDATNVLRPAACAITSLSYDHTGVLGDSIEAIAAEKSAIIKPATPVVCAAQWRDAWPPILEAAERAEAPLVVAARDADEDHVVPDGHPVVHAVAGRPTLGGQPYEIALEEGLAVGTMPLLGRHQVLNAAVAAALVWHSGLLGGTLRAETIRQGLSRVNWPGRFQVVRREPLIVLDAAHNVDSARWARRTLDELARPDRLYVVFGALSDKDVRGMVEALGHGAEKVIVAAPQSPRALPAEEVVERVADLGPPVEPAGSVPAALRLAEDAAHAQDAVLIAGSVYVVGEAMQHYGLAPVGDG